MALWFRSYIAALDRALSFVIVPVDTRFPVLIVLSIAAGVKLFCLYCVDPLPMRTLAGC